MNDMNFKEELEEKLFHLKAMWAMADKEDPERFEKWSKKSEEDLIDFVNSHLVSEIRKANTDGYKSGSNAMEKSSKLEILKEVDELPVRTDEKVDSVRYQSFFKGVTALKKKVEKLGKEVEDKYY